ncbi:aldehyde dehydrogenase family protein [Vibrio cholerae]|uniref:aldehyde dehydrogenase family protein n=1 Tax=Vibrio cholerae TaxID=666 RepID=UPI002DB9C3F0|nr:aldehyde dehydrogenase family protein [Vibrio cholerae]EGR1116198.1 aldehyde dehydrogenase family protein [Vibrio cholerae]MEB5539707.1 aldehyde dehydrogenase family protein [Vibrio cholerae]MEB5548477.1 aldehyde dehydrogenase family protein [Vibrio cholerae]
MSWCKRISASLIEKNKHEIMTIESGFGPTGIPHIGTLCEILRTNLVKEELISRGYNVEFILVSDDLDPFRKIPMNIPNRDLLIPHLGKSVCQVPDPFGYTNSFSSMAENHLMKLAHDYGINCKLIRSSEAYKSGAYNNAIIHFLSNYHKINEICSQTTGALRQRTYSIFMPFSQRTGTVLEHIKVTKTDIDNGEITYFIPSTEVVNKPGFEYAVPLSELYRDEILDEEITISVLNGKCKLQWKADWAMRHMARNIRFEMHGEDLRKSAETANEIAKVLSYTPPDFYPYGLFLDENRNKISKSKGNGFSLDDAMQLLSKDSIKKFLHLDPKKSRRFFPAMSPRINDMVVQSSDVYSHQKISRMISAFHPLNKNAAISFINNKDIFPKTPDTLCVERCIHLYFKEEKIIINGLSDSEANIFKILEKNYTKRRLSSEKSKCDLLLEELIKLNPELSTKELYQFIYKGFFGTIHGPNLKTWLDIHDDEHVRNILINPCKEPCSFNKDALFKNNNTTKLSLPKEEKDMTLITLEDNIEINNVLDYCALLSFKLREKSSELVTSLSGYQCKNVTLDEIDRSCDLLDNINKNQEFFIRKIRGVTSFLPLNQPIYASICFGFVPALMANDVCIRPPTAMQEHYKKFMSVIDLTSFIDTLSVSYDEKEIFLSNRVNVTDAVIFTGTPENALKVRKHFRKNILFILNGAGHNPLIVSDDADLQDAVESSLRVVLYNQGQDCAGPNSILVHANIFNEFSKNLISKLNNMRNLIGNYKDSDVIVGPNSDPEHSLKIASIFRNYRNHCIYGGEINPISGMINPTIFSKPLNYGGNYHEFFAPVFFLQSYEEDSDLDLYFSHPNYKNNAMYISLFGTSKYIEKNLRKDLHLPESILINTDLHLEERGYLPYGGQGNAASCIWINGQRVSGSTLPQRDIFNYLVKPAMAQNE